MCIINPFKKRCLARQASCRKNAGLPTRSSNKNQNAVAAFPTVSKEMDEIIEDVLDKRRPLERALRTRRNSMGNPISAKDAFNNYGDMR